MSENPESDNTLTKYKFWRCIQLQSLWVMLAALPIGWWLGVPLKGMLSGYAAAAVVQVLAHNMRIRAYNKLNQDE